METIVQLYNYMYNCAICIVQSAYCIPICRLARILWIFQFVQLNLHITWNIYMGHISEKGPFPAK